MTTSISVSYKHQEGWHVFQSEELPGLYVASQDARKAYDDVALSIQTLVLLDEGLECKVAPETSYSEFLESLKQPAAERNEVHPAMRNKRFVLTNCATA